MCWSGVQKERQTSQSPSPAQHKFFRKWRMQCHLCRHLSQEVDLGKILPRALCFSCCEIANPSFLEYSDIPTFLLNFRKFTEHLNTFVDFNKLRTDALPSSLFPCWVSFTGLCTKLSTCPAASLCPILKESLQDLGTEHPILPAESERSCASARRENNPECRVHITGQRAENSNPTLYAEIPPTLLLLAPLAHILHREAMQRWFRYQDCKMQGYTTRDCPANITTSATWGSEPKCTFITTAGIALALENSEAQKRARLENYDISTWRNARC